MTAEILGLLITHVWQICLVFGVIFVVGKTLQMKKRPHLMLVLWVLFFVKCLIPPVVQSPISPMAMMTPRFDAAFASAQLESAPGSGAVQQADNANGFNGHLAESTDSSLNGELIATNAISVWAIGSAVVLLLFVVNFLVVRRRIFASAITVESDSGFAEANEVLRKLQSSLAIPSGSVNLVVSNDSLGPLVFGFFRPTIVLPVSMLEKSVQLRPIIAHELCHTWRRDHLLGVLQMVTQALLWFHPLVWIASKNVNQLCEVCCDDDTMRLFKLDSKSYAKGLLDVLSMQRVLQPVAMTPGIRPVEVTKERLKKIVFNRRSGNRRSHAIYICIFLCFVIPAATKGSNGLASMDERPPSVSPKQPAMTTVEVAQRRTEMDFLLGKWEVVSQKGDRIGQSIFAYEKSGKMIREDWTASNGATAQGITFYDPNEACWKMTWVDSSGTIMESCGQWHDSSLVLRGWMTSKDGVRKGAQTKLTKIADGTIRLQLSIESKGKMKLVSSSQYRPSE